MNISIKQLYQINVSILHREDEKWTGLFMEPVSLEVVRKAIEHDLAELMDTCTTNDSDTSIEETRAAYFGHLIELLGAAKPILYSSEDKQDICFAGLRVGNITITQISAFEVD